MKVEFERKPGSQVWIMYNNKPESGTIEACRYVKNVSCMDFETIYENIKYDVKLYNGTTLSLIEPDKLFDSKEDLIKSL